MAQCNVSLVAARRLDLWCAGGANSGFWGMGTVARRGTRSLLAAVLALVLDNDQGFLARSEELGAQKLVAKMAIEAFHIAFLPWALVCFDKRG